MTVVVQSDPGMVKIDHDRGSFYLGRDHTAVRLYGGVAIDRFSTSAVFSVTVEDAPEFLLALQTWIERL